MRTGIMPEFYNNTVQTVEGSRLPKYDNDPKVYEEHI